MPVETITWKNGFCQIIDQTLLPEKLKYRRIRTAREMWEAIRALRIRGAPAIGVAAAYGLYLGIRGSKAKHFPQFLQEAKKTSDFLGTSRPTAVNLFWALERMLHVAESLKSFPIRQIKKALLNEAHLILREDREACVALGDAGARLLKNGARVLTHCNAGGLATSGYGTALAVIYRAIDAGKKITVYADETRPLLQGARLTSWELAHNHIPVTVICDDMAGYIMKLGMIDAVIVGADRIAANGDFANKIGTYGVAVLAKAHGIPFYVAAPLSSFDISLKKGRDIPIEERPGDELKICGGKRIIPEKGVGIFNPAFDVTPHPYVRSFITEKGIITPPYINKIPKLFR
ncbi:S-methyl-5-thioribose-1-phosphate isomerase [Candidatus Sumerlaeota bacterium]|nr:S-methyl-5-thioribose-1-phosphate isomerase [Candidatus Sumerlaeota bacterium]